MKLKKALICGFLALAAMLAVSGCGRNSNDVTETENGYSQEQHNDPAPPSNEPTSNEDGALLDSADVSEPFDFDGEFFFSQGLDENGFWQGINVSDHVEMFNYQALPIPASVHHVPEEDIQVIVDDMMVHHATTEQITNRPVAYGDRINIDFVGSTGGVEFEGGSTMGQGMYVTIGVTQFIDDFLYQLIGHMPGTVVNVEVTFPDDYFEESLQGAEALFITPINYIAGEPILPELTDDFVAENFWQFGDFSTVDELFEDIRGFIQDGSVTQYIHEYISTQVVVNSIPPLLIRYFEQAMLQQYKEEAMQFNIELEDLIGWHGFESIEELIEGSREDIESGARTSLVLQAVAQDADITVTIQDVTNFFIENFGMEDFSMFEEIYGLPWLKQFIRNEKVIEYISERVVFA